MTVDISTGKYASGMDRFGSVIDKMNMKHGKVRLLHYKCLKGHLSGNLAKVGNHTWLNKRNRS